MTVSFLCASIQRPTHNVTVKAKSHEYLEENIESSYKIGLRY